MINGCLIVYNLDLEVSSTDVRSYLWSCTYNKQTVVEIMSIVAGLRKVYPYYFTFTTFTKGRWVGEKILDVFAREFRAHPAEEYVSIPASP